ncbi:hypothetical protein FQ377_14375 [Arthrobacter echini]|uniref:Uncharacterized protein n=1 Tax=Arthrobacter echini TaxID=1529066 RepID=A0A5D0XIS3_9MICC|nr:hypothetical protein [Arthrobacter echini]TYC96089.1 hypothetical protein FQ377_14375 [Arthrobacter echini]
MPLPKGEHVSEWFQIHARNKRNYVWLTLCGQGKPKIMGEPWYTPDGVTDVWSLIEDWRPEKLPFPVWFAPYNGGKTYDDLLWTGGAALKIASTGFIEALRAAEVTGYQTFDVEVRDHAGAPVEEYTGFATDPFPGSDIQNFRGQTGQNYVFIANQRVVDTLHDHGADRLDISPYTPD